jgi:hypothetical protein
MPNPWDRPPLAQRGSAKRVLYEAIGEALMNWEEVEGALAHLYSALVNGRRNTEANQEYGISLNFVGRIHGLKTVACRYFHKHPSQASEGGFDELVRLASSWSSRRNDVAHGRARPSKWIVPSTGPYGELERWFVIPPHFKGDRFTGTVPAYILSSREIRRFGDAFWKLAGRIEGFAFEIERAHRSSLYTRLLPHGQDDEVPNSPPNRSQEP